MKRQFLIGFLVPALAVSASARTLASLPMPHAMPFTGVPIILPDPLTWLRMPLTPAILPPAFILPRLSLTVPMLTPAPALALASLPAVRMTAEQELPASVRRLPPLTRSLAATLREKEDPKRAPVLDDLFDGRHEPNPRPEQRFELPEAELERELGLGTEAVGKK